MVVSISVPRKALSEGYENYKITVLKRMTETRHISSD